MQSTSAVSANSVSSGATSAAIGARVEALRSRHEALSNKIEMEQGRSGSSDWYLRALKQQKLHLKEEIEALLSSH
jgi:hypothetical protein